MSDLREVLRRIGRLLRGGRRVPLMLQPDEPPLIDQIGSDLVLIVARTLGDAAAEVDRHGSSVDHDLVIVTTEHRWVSLPSGLSFVKVIWCAGWDRGPAATYVDAFVRRNLAKRPGGIEEVRL